MSLQDELDTHIEYMDDVSWMEDYDIESYATIEIMTLIHELVQRYPKLIEEEHYTMLGSILKHIKCLYDDHKWSFNEGCRVADWYECGACGETKHWKDGDWRI